MAVHVQLPLARLNTGLVGMADCTTAEASGITEVDLNGVPHIGLIMHNDEQTVMAVLTPNEAANMAQIMSMAAVATGKRWAAGEGPKGQET